MTGTLDKTPEQVIAAALRAGDAERAALRDRGHDPAEHERLVCRLENAVAGLLAAQQLRLHGVRSPGVDDVARWRRYLDELRAALDSDPPGPVPMPPRRASLRLTIELDRARAERPATAG